MAWAASPSALEAMPTSSGLTETDDPSGRVSSADRSSAMVLPRASRACCSVIPDTSTPLMVTPGKMVSSLLTLSTRTYPAEPAPMRTTPAITAAITPPFRLRFFSCGAFFGEVFALFFCGLFCAGAFPAFLETAEASGRFLLLTSFMI